MYKEQLPENCPPKTAVEIEGNLFRIIKENGINDDDFIPYARQFHNNPRYQQCKCFAVSFYNSANSALLSFRNALKRNKILGKYLVEIEFKKEFGKSEITKRTGHVSFWFYKKCNLDDLSIIGINGLNGN